VSQFLLFDDFAILFLFYRVNGFSANKISNIMHHNLYKTVCNYTA